MDDTAILEMLKADLEIIAANTAHDSYLSMLIQAAKTRIAEEGITLSSSINDGMLVVQYAAWLYRKRVDDAPGIMPRHLRWELNNRLFGQKV